MTKHKWIRNQPVNMNKLAPTSVIGAVHMPHGGGGALWYLWGGGGTYARYQNLKIPLKHWFLAKNAPLFF